MIQQKIVHKISLNFPELFIIGKYIKIRLKTGGTHAIFSVLEVKRSKTLQKLTKDTVFVFVFWFHFSWHFSRKNRFTQKIYNLTCVWLIF